MSTERRIRRAPTQVLERTLWLCSWVGRVSWLCALASVVLGVWVDRHWLLTTPFPVLTWYLAYRVTELLEDELWRRKLLRPWEDPRCS